MKTTLGRYSDIVRRCMPFLLGKGYDIRIAYTQYTETSFVFRFFLQRDGEDVEPTTLFSGTPLGGVYSVYHTSDIFLSPLELVCGIVARLEDTFLSEAGIYYKFRITSGNTLYTR